MKKKEIVNYKEIIKFLNANFIIKYKLPKDYYYKLTGAGQLKKYLSKRQIICLYNKCYYSKKEIVRFKLYNSYDFKMVSR